METAIREFQKYAGLPVTGRLDKATSAKMESKRCGLPDKQRFHLWHKKWFKKHLTYYIEKYGKDLSRPIQARIFAKAVKYWSDESGLSFSKASSAGSADLKIR